ncbi:enoyl-CoA hydratase [Pseudonocardia kunmingensis]|uniref:Enoyl-CoA hydratase n=1 Tax=Pseudonocardia kunmingensis TaxID=630975 RepID=A0A543DPP6_9PSEU|nr:enoyl-CoA hydratase [Pseudonocardia kunmingensis]TQM11278.1 enoyl-CoA hydratase [Pseudonocardia kunmingensis]
MIEVGRFDRVAVIRLDRQAKRNALNVELCHVLREAVQGAVDDGARSIVLTGNGTSFCSGADLDEVYTAEFRQALYAMLRTVTDAPVPIVAAVNGPAVGAGTQLAIAADLRVVAPGAFFAVPTAKIGLAVDPWTIRRLALLAGNGTARALLLACDQLDAAAARASGLAERGGGLEHAIEWAGEMADLAPLTVAYSKRVLNDAFEPALDDEHLAAAFEACWASEDFAEGRRARSEKRGPVFRGR